MTQSQNADKPNAGKDVEEQELLFTTSVNAKCNKHFGRQQFFTKLNIVLTCDLTVFLLRIHPKK